MVQQGESFLHELWELKKWEVLVVVSRL